MTGFDALPIGSHAYGIVASDDAACFYTMYKNHSWLLIIASRCPIFPLIPNYNVSSSLSPTFAFLKELWVQPRMWVGPCLGGASTGV